MLGSAAVRVVGNDVQLRIKADLIFPGFHHLVEALETSEFAISLVQLFLRNGVGPAIGDSRWDETLRQRKNMRSRKASRQRSINKNYISVLSRRTLPLILKNPVPT